MKKTALLFSLLLMCFVGCMPSDDGYYDDDDGYSGYYITRPYKYKDKRFAPKNDRPKQGYPDSRKGQIKRRNKSFWGFSRLNTKNKKNSPIGRSKPNYGRSRSTHSSRSNSRRR